MNKRTLGVAVGALLAVVVLGAGTGLWLAKAPQKGSVQSAEITPTPTPTAESAAAGLSYQGQDGKTALELLRAADAEAETKGEGANAFVTAIKGYAASDSKKEYWAFYVNGQMSEVGAGTYVTKSTDRIEWKLATY